MKLHVRDKRGPGRPFTCTQCGSEVTTDGRSPRNHCPRCLWSKHVDVHPGDREADCGGMMEPIAISVRKGGEWSVVHRCRRCGSLDVNLVAGDDSELVLLSLAVRPLAQSPFPLHVVNVDH